MPGAVRPGTLGPVTEPAPSRLLLLALVGGLLAAGLPAAYVLSADGSPLVAGLIALLGLLPAALALLLRSTGDRSPG